ncbi:SDR family NAD(P)-dependent oxidoreductase [Bradymonadaceae bacterium TMQ3]|nr:SDR family NAD(P)-dependent oxidoreductase [Bradymonadaceae bacterium TMQ3]TXC68579.1 SDR family NAD(P)-dependent oxidoreductase [Bradymonadales bacterium TMQ1]
MRDIRSTDRVQVFVYFQSVGESFGADVEAREAGAHVVWVSREAAGERVTSCDWARIEPDEDLSVWSDVAGVVLACEHRFDVDALRRKVQFLKEAGQGVWVEVCSATEARVAADLGVDGVVICGMETGGLCGEESGLVLLGRVQREVGVPAVVRGAMGPDAAAAAMVAGASGYVLEEALWLCEGMEPSAEAVKVLERVGATDTRCLGVVVGARYRAWSLLATRPTRELAAREIDFVDADQDEGAKAYLATVQARRFDRWETLDPRRDLWPMGQGGALARVFRKRYGRVGAAVRGVREHVDGVMGAIGSDFPLEAGKGIARLNGTRLPIHQGPMAQVSDTPEFAKAVVEAGALPWLALGNMPTEVAQGVIEATATCLGDAPFGAGIIGLEANPYRDSHIDEMSVVGRRRGNFLGLVAAGSAEQAMRLEREGLITYLHTPTPGVLEAALKQGQRHSIWEGAEAGGHVGTLGALALWQMGVIVVEEALASGVEPSDVAVVLAGGISGAESAAAAAAMLFGLHRRGVAVGIQMGTAYLMCREAVESGAVSRTYQEVARCSPGTVIMGESVNTPTRVLKSVAADRVLAREVERLKEGVKLGERKHLYERDNLGGLRAAAKSERIAEVFAEGGARFERLSEEEQLESGLFHCGQGVRLCDARTIAALHQEVSEGARRWAQARWTWSQALEVADEVGTGARRSDEAVLASASIGCQATEQGSRAGTGSGARRSDTSTELGSGARHSDMRAELGSGARHSDMSSGVNEMSGCQASEHRDDQGSMQRQGEAMVERTHGVLVDGDRAVAIVGIGAKMPGALSASKFWENILFGVSAIKEVPADRWDPALYFDEDPAAPDKTYSKIGGWIEGFEFDRRRFRMPPRVVASVDPTQLLCLEAVHEALEDAGYLEREFPRDRCAVILGNALGGDLRDDSTLRILYPKMDQALRGALMALSASALSGGEREALLAEVEARFKGELGEVSEDSMPGELANVIAGRVAQVFDLRGPNFVTDAACASSLAAIEAGVRGLRSGEYDMVVCGGADRTMGPTSFVKFSKIGALSPDGSRPFDEGANGFVMGEGAGILVLKRLSDAIEDGDSIYAVIRGVGGSSDGKGKAITAPNPEGQRRALDRAYEDAGFGPRSVSLFEAHGTSTPVGDPTEVASLRAALVDDAGEWAAERVALGSVKSMIGHLKSAAGAAGVIKVAMALKHQVLPPTLGVERVNPALELEGTRVKVQTEAQPWEVFPGQVRRAGVSAFGFGGTNFHVVLEEYQAGQHEPGARRPDIGSELGSGARRSNMGAELGSGARHSNEGSELGSGARRSNMGAELGSGARRSNEGILGLSAASVEELENVIDEVMQRFAHDGVEGVTQWRLPLLGYDDGVARRVDGQVRLAVAFGDVQELQERLERAKRAAGRNKGWKVLAHQGVVLGERPAGGKLAMLFPGQGTQYLGMLSALKERFEVVRRTFEEADEVMLPVLGRRLSEVIDPGVVEGAEAERRAFVALTQTEITQPAVLTADIALYRLLGELGIVPQVVAGHSLGEYGACVAAGIMSFADALRTVAARGTEMAKVTPMNGDTGLMAGVSASVEVVQPVLDRIEGYVVCANINCPTQTIIAGLSEPVRQAVSMFEEMGLQAPFLPVSHAFHTEVVAAASEPLRRHLGHIEVGAPRVPILTNVTGGYYPSGVGCEEAIRDLLSEQVAAPVQFIKVIETMYAGGARAFVEVGPKRAQASFVGSILEGRSHLALHTNHPKKGDVASLYEALAGMWAAGVWRPGEVVPGVRVDEVPGVRADADRVPGDRSEEAARVPGVRADADRVPGDRSEEAARVPGVRTEVERASIDAELMRVLCEQTGYESEEIEFDYELEADLGVDTVKQAEIMAQVRELYGLERDESFRLSEYPTLRRMGDYVAARVGMMAEPAMVPGDRSEDVARVPGVRAEVERASIDAELMRVLCEQTGYESEEIEFDYELEADLGVDTVKQAEIMAQVRELYGLERDESFRLSEYPTLRRMGDYVAARVGMMAEPAMVPGDRLEEAALMPGDRLDADRVPGDRSEEAARVPGVRTEVERASIDAELMRVLCEQTGYESEEIEFDYELEADLGVDTVKQAEIMAQVRELYGLERDESFRLSEYPTLRRMGDYVAARVGLMAEPALVPGVRSEADRVPGVRSDVDRVPGDRSEEAARVPGVRTDVRAATIDATPHNAPRDTRFDRFDSIAQSEDEATPLDGALPYRPNRHAVEADVEISGCAVGLPGEGAIFRRHAIDELLEGKNMIGQVPVGAREAMVNNRIVRLQKHEGGGGEMRQVTEMAEVIKLAGLGNDFDLEEWGVPERLRASLDRTSQLAFAAGFEALRDAGLPLVPRYRETTTGKRVTIGWTLPESVGRETGVIFASAFAGQDALIEELQAQRSEDYQFNHRFLLLVLGIANSRFAEFVGARGPNTKINNACASTTTAVGMAQDWIRCGRCKRVLILSADEASGSTLMEWIGSGFLATGAATTEGDVSQAALPFDRRRHGMIIGMGALSLVVEKAGLAEARGIEPIADVLATRFVNSAHHPTRLDVDHIAAEVSGLVEEVEQRFGVRREAIADRTVFISHETYTPARGGSASAEIAALRRSFGEKANRVVIANTKGFTGHAMAAGIEDVLAMKVLQRQVVPPIANFEEPDPELGDLRLSQGGSYPADYALRLAAGFGSQLALAFFRYRARREQRVFDPVRYSQWLEEVSGASSFELEVASRVLRLRPIQPEDRPPGGREDRDERTRSLPLTSPVPLPAPGAVMQHNASPAVASMDAVRRPAPGLVAGAENASFSMRPVAIEAARADATDVLCLQRELSCRVVALVGGPVLVAELFAKTLREFGAQVVRLASDRRRGPLDETGLDLCDEAMLCERFNRHQVDAVINLLGVVGSREDAEDVYLAARHTFHVARAFQAHRDDRGPGTARSVQGVQEDRAPGTVTAAFMSVTMMGGCFGLNPGSSPSVAGGAVSGFTKSLAREWEWARVKVVDVAGEELEQRLVTEVLGELVGGRRDCEVGLTGGLSHRPVVLEASDLRGSSSKHPAPGPGSVILVTGGGRGISAEVCVDLARRFRCALALVGRTPLTHPDPLRVDLKAERTRIKEALKAAGERATPVAVRQKMRPLEAQQEIATNLKRMRQAGARAEYFSCDVADAAQVQRLVSEVEACFGRVSGVIHGAGVEDSRLLADKDVQGFDRVFRGKAVGGVNLWRALGDRGLVFYVAFTSVAGRFGNAGQTDYAAANDALARQVMQINQLTRERGRGARALAIDWTAWDEVGMAVEGSMRTILEAKGVEFLPPEVGAPMVGESLERGLIGEFVVAGELGELGGQRGHGDRASDRMPGTRATHQEDRRPGTVTSFAMIDRVVAKASDEVVVERIFDPQRDYFLKDHRYEGRELVPGVMGYELMSAAAMMLTGEPVAEVRDVKFERALKLAYSEPIRVRATARVVGQEDGRATVDVQVGSERVVRTGKTVRQEHFFARVICGSPLTRKDAPECRVGEEKTWCKGPDREAIYRRFFHTGSFQLLSGEVWHHEGAILATGEISNHRLQAGTLAQHWVSDPLVRELGLQTVGLWGLMHHGRTYLPLGIGCSRTSGQASVGEPLLVRASRLSDAAEGTIAFDVEVRGHDGRLLQMMERVEMIAHAPLRESDRLAPGPEVNYLEVALSAAEARAMLDAGGGDIAGVLSAAELQGYERLRSARRRGEWLAARLAAREAARRWALMFYGERIDSRAVCVFKSESGEPQLRWSDEAKGGGALPALSLTHTSGQAVAVVSMPGAPCRLGVDLEPLEARSEAFGSAYFSAGERSLEVGTLVAGQRETALWTVKEAVSKALGLGLQLSAAEIEIVAVRPEDAGGADNRSWRVPGERVRAVVEVALHGQALARQVELGVRLMRVTLQVEEGFAKSVALAWGPGLRDAKEQAPGTEADGRAAREDRAPGTGANTLSDDELAAVVALLRHRGVWGSGDEAAGDSPVVRRSLSPWKV